MGSNYHTPLVDGTSVMSASNLNNPSSSIDRAVTYGRNVIVHCDGSMVYHSGSGEFQYDGHLRFVFNRADGQLIQNILVPGEKSLTSGQCLSVTLSETNQGTPTLNAATLSSGEASVILDYNEVALGIVNWNSSTFFAAHPGLCQCETV